MLEKVKIYEEKRLKRTLEEVGRQLEEKQSERQVFLKNMRTAYKSMWEEVEATPNDMNDLDQLVQAKQYLDEMRNMESAYQSSAKKLLRLDKMKTNPYFGRIDFIEKGENSAEEIYIGITMVQNEDSLEILVYDWRAPISGMFYDYDTGLAKYDTPTGTIEGELTLKRQFRIKDGKIEFMFDSAVKIDDEILQELLGQSKDEKMKTIVTSIQREQNLAIRDEGHKLLIVEGPAGSGKTSIALHRIAFLLYRYRSSITNANVVIFSPNEMFNDYISEVLPELGEENVRQTTFMEYAKVFLKEKLKIQDLNQQMEFILTYGNKEGYANRIQAIRYKSSVDFLTTLKKYIDWLHQNPWEFEDFGAGEYRIISKEQQQELFRTEYTYLPIIPRLKKIRNRVLFLIKQLEHDRINEMDEKMSHDPQWMDTRPKERKNRAARYVLKQFQPYREKARGIGKITVKEYYTGLYREENLSRGIAGTELMSTAGITLKRLEKGVVLYEDLAPMLYLKGKLDGIPTKDYIRHVIIDEVQDYTPLQMEIIRELFPVSSFTAVGDLNQSINPYANIGNIEALKDIFQVQDDTHIRLGRSYRSTREITEFCRLILGQDQGAEFINRKGHKPTVAMVSDMDECLTGLIKNIPEMLGEGYKSVAVICRTRAEAEELYPKLQQHIPCHLVNKADASFPKGISVMPSYLSKGLEFDAAFILNLTHPYQAMEERNLFYTVCTRALHRLFIYTFGTIPEYIQGIPEEMIEIVRNEGR